MKQGGWQIYSHINWIFEWFAIAIYLKLEHAFLIFGTGQLLCLQVFTYVYFCSDLTRVHEVISPSVIPTSVNEFGYLAFRCVSDDNPAVIQDQYSFVPMTSFLARSSRNLIISESNLTRNLDNAIFLCRTLSVTGETYDTTYRPFKVFCKLTFISYYVYFNILALDDAVVVFI